VEEAIILEDDCLPHPSFFRFCDELLARYRDDERVWMVSGEGFQGSRARGDASYFFSRTPMIWGWATWRRAWARYDGELATWPAFRDADGLSKLFGDPIVAKFWTEIFERLRIENKPDSWGYRWALSMLAGGGFAATPKGDLVTNIGFGADATHTAHDHTDGRHAALPIADLGTIRHPAEVTWDEAADAVLFDNAFGGEKLRESARRDKTLHRRLKRRWDAFRRRVGLKR
jgi:hypothetical protein